MPGRIISRRKALAGLGLAPFALAAGSACDGGPAPNVFAASSLTEALTDAADRVAEDGMARPNLNFAASSVLATQILEGAPADLFVSADKIQMDRLVAKQLTTSPRVVATNQPTVIAGAGAALDSFRDLRRPGLRLILAGPAVPIGRYARLVLDRAAASPAYGPEFREAVLSNVRSEELSARAVLAKVELGEADAGIVFRTDARVADEGTVTLGIPSPLQVRAVYPAADVRDSAHRAEAEAFLAFLLSPSGQALLVRRGFDAAGADS